MNHVQSLALAAAGLLLAAFCGWRGARSPDPRRGPRLVPWRLLMLLFAAGAIYLLLQLLQLLQTARNAG